MPKFKDWIAARTEATIAGDDELYVRDDSGDVSQRITVTDLAAAIGGGGGGGVTSVNGETGVVVLDADDIDDTSTTNKFATAAQLSAVDGLAATYQPLDADLTTLAGGGLPSNLETTLDAQYQPLASVLTNTTASFTTADESKLDGIEALADVTDTANVTAAGALMDSEVDADIKTLSLPANTTISTFGASLVDDADQATARTTLGVVIGTDVQAYDADTLKADTADTLTAGFDSSDYAAGTKSTGTYTPAPADGNFQVATNGGAHTLAPPATSCSIVIHYTNNGSAGAITTSGFTAVTGDAFTTTDTHEFVCVVTKINDVSVLNVTALQ